MILSLPLAVSKNNGPTESGGKKQTSVSATPESKTSMSEQAVLDVSAAGPVTEAPKHQRVITVNVDDSS